MVTEVQRLQAENERLRSMLQRCRTVVEAVRKGHLKRDTWEVLEKAIVGVLAK